MKRSVIIKTTVTAVLLLSLIGWVVWVWVSVPDHEETQSDPEEYFPMELGGDFTLDGHSGSPVSLRHYRGKVVILLFGFSHCPDICPTQLSMLKVVMDKLGSQAGSVQVLFVTVDPKRDTPEHLKEYMAHFHPTFLGLTGPRDKIMKIARQYGTSVSEGEKSGSGYRIDHSSYIYLINQQGAFSGLYPNDTTADKLVGEIRRVVGR